MIRLYWSCFGCVIVALCTWAGQAPEEAEKLAKATDSELVTEVKGAHWERRMAALSLLALRYRPPNAPVIHSKYPPQEAYKLSKSVPDDVVAVTLAAAKDDPETLVRLVAIETLKRFLARTNTLPMFDELLTSTKGECAIRIAEILTDVAKQNGTTVPPNVVSALNQCLSSEQNPDLLVRALRCLEKLGTAARPATLEMKRLTRHEKATVRSAAKSALKQTTRDL